jgi:hypothetical protein
MLDDLYREFKLPVAEWNEEYDLTLGIDTSKFPKTQSKTT